MNLSFTRKARNNYFSIKNHISVKWGKNAANIFEYKVRDFFSLLKIFPEMGIIEVKEKNIRSFQLSKQTRVFYRLTKDKIIILSFFDVRQNPDKKFK